MAERWLDITDTPAEGREFVFEDQTLWNEGLAEFGMDFTLDGPVTATFTVIPEKQGVLVRGRLEGVAEAPCARCTAPTAERISQGFDLFFEEQAPPGEESLEPSLIRRKGSMLELDAGSMLWEEFVLALPVKPLCREDCKGLCPQCGADLNGASCACDTSAGDPRLAALRNLKIDK